MNFMHKDKRIVFLLSLLAVIYAVFIYLDIVSKYFFISQILKYTGVAFCFLSAAFTYEYSFRRDDAKLLILGLFVTLIADALFLFASAFALGIIFFSFVQLFYIRRYKKDSFKRNLFMALIFITFCIIGFALGLQLPYISLLGIVYAVLIITATGLAFRSNLPKINKKLIETGMILFLFCDTNVMLSFFALKISLFYEITSNLVWVFYIPSQVLLSLSAVDYELNKHVSISSRTGQPFHTKSTTNGRQN